MKIETKKLAEAMKNEQYAYCDLHDLVFSADASDERHEHLKELKKAHEIFKRCAEFVFEEATKK